MVSPVRALCGQSSGMNVVSIFRTVGAALGSDDVADLPASWEITPNARLSIEPRSVSLILAV